MTTSCYAAEPRSDSSTHHSSASSPSARKRNTRVQRASRRSAARVCSKEEPTAGPGELDDIVEQAQQIIWDERNIGALNVHEVARQLPVTRRTLDRRFAENLGRTVLDEINRCRLYRAMRLLAETDLLIKTVSYMAGFPSRERMRLAFLSDHGMTPSEYRESMQ